ncbi:MAG: hypothetical protein FP810_14445 [Desulfocapsa sp.]|nr:hypothetical protein [Desulfocapsa sp.]MCG2744706.1 hypothetical protein [Desulfobacteraceae bacterium]
MSARWAQSYISANNMLHGTQKTFTTEREVFSLPCIYERLRAPAWLTPACGGLLVGCVGLFACRMYHPG